MSLSRKNLCLSAFVALSLSSGVAGAGTLLKLNSGTVDPKGLRSGLLKAVSQSGALDRASEVIVQFEKAVTEKDKAVLLQKNFEIFGYLPDDALVVRGATSKLEDLRLLRGVRAVIPYLPDYKLSKNIGHLSVFNKDQREVFVLKTFKDSDAKLAAKAIREQMPSARILAVQGRSVVLSASLGHAQELAAISGVEHVQLDPQLRPLHMEFAFDDFSTFGAGDYTDLAGDESGTQVMNFSAAWNQGLFGQGQIAAMADTGLDSGNASAIHQDFAGSIVAGQAVGLFGKSWEDPMGHGTHVAGSILGRGTASGGLLKGGAPQAGMVAQGMWSPMLKNLSVPSKLGDLFTKAFNEGARVHSNSWGGARTFGSYDNFAIQVDEWMWNNPDMLIVFAAGNSGVDADKDGRIDENSMASPGTAKNVLTVGASENVTKTGGIQVPISKLRTGKDSWGAEPIYSSLVSDNANGVAMFSSRGPTADGRIKPDVVAPGTNILSVKSQHKEATPLWGAYNSDYVWSGGTSMATPLTAGAATLARQYLIEKRNMVNPSAALMKAYMLHHAVDMFPGQYGAVGKSRGQELLTRRPNSDEGFGRVDVSQLVSASGASLLVDNKAGAAQGEEVIVAVKSSGGRFLANLAWTDAPGSPNAAQALVNDLDMSLVGPQGVVKLAQDKVNNHEIIEFDSLPAGDYQLIVRGAKVPMGRAGKQPYALVVSF